MPLYAAHELDLIDLPPSLEPLRDPIYNGMDSCLTSEINVALNHLPGAKSNLIYNFERALQAPVLDMQERGFRVDPDSREVAIGNTHIKLDAAKRILNALTQAVCDRDVNFASHHQLKRLFYEDMDIRPITKFVKGESKETMDRDTLEKILNYFYARPIANAVLLARDLTKTLQVLETEIDRDWRWRCSYNIGGTDSWRFSSSKSSSGSGSNFQNITSDLRRVFIPDPNFILYGFDKEQAESREVGYLCGILFDDWSYLNACESGDLHTFSARLIWPNLPWTGDLKRDRKIADQLFYRHFTYRDMSKRGGHATNYVGKPPTIAMHLNCPVRLIIDFQEAYFSAFPCIPRMHHWVARQLQTNQYLLNVFGARRDFFDRPNTDETIRSAVAHLFQSATAMDLNLGLWRVWKHERDRVQLLAQLHDAIYFQSHRDHDQQAVVERVTELMRVELSCRGRRFSVPVEGKSGFNWAPRWKFDADGTPQEWNKWGLDKICDFSYEAIRNHRQKEAV